MFKVLVGSIVLITCINAKTTNVKLSEIDEMNVVKVIDEKDMSKYEIVNVSESKTNTKQKTFEKKSLTTKKSVKTPSEVNKLSKKTDKVKVKKSGLSSSTFSKKDIKKKSTLPLLSNKEKALKKLNIYLKKPYTTKKYKKQFVDSIVYLIKNETKIDIEFVKNMSLDEENIKELIQTLEEIQK